MNYETKWGCFGGNEEDYKAFVKEMERREKPEKVETESAPVKKTRPKKTAE